MRRGAVNRMCDYCEKGKPLVTGRDNDRGITLHYPDYLMAYGYDVHGYNSNGLIVQINFCPVCGEPLGKNKSRCK